MIPLMKRLERLSLVAIEPIRVLLLEVGTHGGVQLARNARVSWLSRRHDLHTHIYGLSISEAAEELDLPVGTVKSRSHRAHHRLMAALGERQS